MAIYSAVPPPEEPQAATAEPQPPPAAHHRTPSIASTATLDIEAWTVSALQSLTISPVARGTGTPLTIPLDAHDVVESSSSTRRADPTLAIGGVSGIAPPRRPPSRRDSQRKREALLKGKEGSRQRRRWENARLMHVPNAQPPLPSDWEVHPTHPVHHVPYQLAQYWDKGLRQQAEQRQRQGGKTGAGKRPAGPLAAQARAGRVPRELRDTAKRSPAVRSWVRVLEEPVRRFLAGAAADAAAAAAQDGQAEEEDSDEEEIVFVGRNGSTAEREGREWKPARREIDARPVDTGLVLDSGGEDGADDQSGAFKRWLTHSISDYYGLESRSLSVGNPARKVVYIGIRTVGPHCGPPVALELPQPLWELC